MQNLLRTNVVKNRSNRPEEYLRIEGERPVLDIVDVEGAAFIERDVAPTGHLGEAREARLHGQ